MNLIEDKLDLGYSEGIAYASFRGSWGFEEAIAYKNQTQFLKKILNPNSISGWIALIDHSNLLSLTPEAAKILSQVRFDSYSKHCIHTLYYKGSNENSAFSSFYLGEVHAQEKIDGLCSFRETPNSTISSLKLLQKKYSAQHSISFDEEVIEGFLLGKKLKDILY